MREGGGGREGGRWERGEEVRAWDVGCGRLGFDSWKMGSKGWGGGDLYLRCGQGSCTCRRGGFCKWGKEPRSQPCSWLV